MNRTSRRLVMLVAIVSMAATALVVVLDGRNAAQVPNAVPAPQQVNQMASRSDDVVAAPPAPAKPSLAPIGPSGPGLAGFESQEDLFNFATGTADSNDAWTLQNGWEAVGVCLRVKEQVQRFSTFDHSNAGVERARAAKLALNRCKGFVENDIEATKGLRERIRQKLALHPEVYTAGVSLGAVSEMQLTQAIRQSDWLTVRLAVRELSSNALHKQGVDPHSEQGTLYRVAFTQALCDIGRDCGENSISYAVLCIESDFCKGSLENVLGDGMSPVQQRQVARFRHEIAAAMAAGNADYFSYQKPGR